MAAVAADTEEIAEQAVELIKVEYEDLPAIFDPREALKPSAPRVHDNPSDYRHPPFIYPEPNSNVANHFKVGSDGTALFVENMPFAFLPQASELLAVLDQYGDPNIGMVYDVANGHFIKEDVALAIRSCARRLQVVHLSDTTRQVYRHDAIGLGSVDFSVVPPALREIGFTRRPVLESIDAEPDTSIECSVRRLQAAGWTPRRCIPLL